MCCRVLVTARRHASLVDRFPDVHRLEVHPEDGWNGRRSTRGGLTCDLVQQRVKFNRVKTLNICEAAVPATQPCPIANGVARSAIQSLDAWQRHNIRIYLWRVIIIQTLASRSAHK